MAVMTSSYHPKVQWTKALRRVITLYLFALLAGLTISYWGLIQFALTPRAVLFDWDSYVTSSSPELVTIQSDYFSRGVARYEFINSLKCQRPNGTAKTQDWNTGGVVGDGSHSWANSFKLEGFSPGMPCEWYVRIERLGPFGLRKFQDLVLKFEL